MQIRIIVDDDHDGNKTTAEDEDGDRGEGGDEDEDNDCMHLGSGHKGGVAYLCFHYPAKSRGAETEKRKHLYLSFV